MGNTPSTPPPLFEVNASGNSFLVPLSSTISIQPPPTKGGYHPPPRPQPWSRSRPRPQGEQRGPIYEAVDAPYHGGERERKRKGRHVRGRHPDISFEPLPMEEGSVSESQSQSTQLGEIQRGYGKDIEKGSGARRAPRGWDPRAFEHRGAPTGYSGLRGGQDMGTDDRAMRTAMYPGMPHTSMQHPDMSPLPGMPPRYASRESVPRYATGAVGMPNVNPYASYPLQRPPSSESSSSGPEASPNRVPLHVQEAINQAVLRSAQVADRQEHRPSRSKQKTPTPEKKDKTGTLNDGWGEGINICKCTTSCKCRKGQRATGWYQGTARNPDGEEIPVSGKLNTRWVLDDDIGKDCGDHSHCKRDSNSSSDTETSRSNIVEKRNSKKSREKARDDKLEELKTEIDRMKKAARIKHRSGHLFAQSDCDLEPSIVDPRYPDPAMLAQLRMMELRGDPYRTTDRMGGMKALGMAQGVFDSMTMRNQHGPRMPPKRRGMRMQVEDVGFMEPYGTSSENPYAQPSEADVRARKTYPSQLKRQARSGFRRGTMQTSDSEPRTAFDRSSGGNCGKTFSKSHARGGRRRPRFGPGDSDLDLRLGRRPEMGTPRDNAGETSKYDLVSRSHTISTISLHLAENPTERDEDALPQHGWPLVIPLRRGSEGRNKWTTDRQARVETDDDRDC